MDDQNTQPDASRVETLPVAFKFENHTVRMISKRDEIWFVAADVCEVLELKNTSQVISRLDNDEKGVHTVETLRGAQELGVVNESGLYSLIFTSRKPESKKFRKWVTNEVLPSIRETGRYETGHQAAIEHAQRRFQDIYSGDFVDPDALLQILFGARIPFSGHEKFRFLAGPACAGLGLRDPAAALDRIPDSEQGTVTIYTSHGPEQLPAITEAAMYYLAFTPRNRPDVIDCARDGHGAGIQRPFDGDDHIDGLNLRLLSVLTTKLDFHWAYFRPRHPALDDAGPLLRDFESTLQAAATLAAQYAELGFDPPTRTI
ncbi:hypothetical protein MPC4_110067 [Methylocella tundrae]|uniref:Bro-N domain-containing protein n=1 Tax=Methylocella tundrae TaxID=227605 RepID=A0A8B6M155_METTU|nr:Bro-N domain-containing protein [Methylocella tundrae]VTZ26120.1 hypothetical protein MPC1_2890003 [Methylocella tundrae]VTZ48767.1 hypothetical protein MPC4_110067 [Methylocella tundrae]